MCSPSKGDLHERFSNAAKRFSNAARMSSTPPDRRPEVEHAPLPEAFETIKARKLV
jgi:hypothetical protein